MRLFTIAGLTAVVIVALLCGMSLFVPADQIGGWVRILAWGVLLACPSVAWLLLRDISRNRPPEWSRALLCVAGGCLLSLVTYTVTAAVMAKPLKAALQRVQIGAGCADFDIATGTYRLCADRGGIYDILRDPAVSEPAAASLALRAAEDVDQQYDLFGMSLRGKLRVLVSLGRDGGSGVCEQVARMALQIPHGHGLQRVIGKIRTDAACVALDGSTSRQQQVTEYATMAPFGSVSGMQVQGVGAAARLFFEKKPEDLNLTQDFILAALPNQPSGEFPMQRPGESWSIVQVRRARLYRHLQRIVQNAVGHQMLTPPQAATVLGGFTDAFATTAEFRAALPPQMRMVDESVREHVPDYRSRLLAVVAPYDPCVQQRTEEGMRIGLDRVRSLLPAGLRGKVRADVAVLNIRGGLLAATNLFQTPTDVGSVQKIALYPESLQTGVLQSMHTRVLGMRANDALAYSDRPVAYELVRRLTPHVYAGLLAAKGLFIIANPALAEQQGYASVADGAGIEGSPATVAADMRILTGFRPGVLIGPAVVDRIVDAPTGSVLYAQPESQVYAPWAAEEVGQALQLTPLIGTAAPALGSLAKMDPGLRAKTGTPHWHDRLGRLHGAGGAWCVVADRKFVVAARVDTGQIEIPLEGDSGACPVVGAVLRNLRSGR